MTATTTAAVLVPAGMVTLGRADTYPEEQPVMTRRVDEHLTARAPVTVAEFAAFVDATGYVTSAERAGWSIAFVRPTLRISRPGHWWREVAGLSWRHAYDHGLSDHPVTHVSVLDAEAYCAHVGGRLPTEAEWVHAAALGGHTEDFTPGTANTWLGDFPRDREWFGSPALTTPVGRFGEDELGCVDRIGNVWEITASHWTGTTRGACCAPGDRPASGKHVKKGGSFACHPRPYCERYRPAARQPVDVDTNTTAHNGFRVVWEVGH